MSKSNVYSALIEEKISRSKNLFINSSQELEQTTVIMAGSNVVTSLNLSWLFIIRIIYNIFFMLIYKFITLFWFFIYIKSLFKLIFYSSL